MTQPVVDVAYFGGTAQRLASLEPEPCAWRIFCPDTLQVRFFDATDLEGIDEPLRVYRDDGWQIVPLYAPEGTVHPPSRFA